MHFHNILLKTSGVPAAMVIFVFNQWLSNEKCLKENRDWSPGFKVVPEPLDYTLMHQLTCSPDPSNIEFLFILWPQYKDKAVHTQPSG